VEWVVRGKTLVGKKTRNIKRNAGKSKTQKKKNARKSRGEKTQRKKM
jgi:hypothetical protein